MENNRFIEKFKFKSKSELEHKVSNPEQFEPESILAAKYILDNYSKYEEEKQEKIKSLIKPPVFKEKSFFKNKLLYRITVLISLIFSIYKVFHGYHNESYVSYIWASLYFSFFIVLISKHKKSLKLLKILCGVSILFIILRYSIIFFKLGYLNISYDDFKFSAVCLFFILGGDLLIETRVVQINK